MQGIEMTPEREKALREYQAKVRVAQNGVLGCGFFLVLGVAVYLLLNYREIIALLDAVADEAARIFPN